MKYFHFLIILIALVAQSWAVDSPPVAFLGIGGPSVASQLAAPGPIGSTTASTGSFTTLTSKSLTNNGTTDSIIISNGATGSKAYYGMAINGVTLSYLFCNSAAIPIAFSDNANAWNPMTYTAGAVGAGHVDWAGTLDASAIGTASQTVAGGFTVAKRSFLGTIGSSFAGNVLAGVQSGSSAVSGQVGELLSNGQSTYTNFTTTATYQQLATVSVTPGDWHWVATITLSGNGATLTAGSNAIFALSTTTASAAGAVEGLSIVYLDQNILGTSKQSLVFDGDLNISTTTSYFLNGQATFTVGNAQYVCNLAFRRQR